MFHKYMLIMVLFLVSCGEANDLDLDSIDLASYDKDAMEELIDEGQAERVIDIIRAKEQLGMAKSEDFLVLADVYMSQLNGVATQVAIDKARVRGASIEKTALRMGSAYMLQRRLQEAKEELRNVMLSGQDGFDALILQADLAVQEGEEEIARKYYGYAAEIQPDNYRVYLGLALLELNGGNLDAAEAAAKTAWAKNSENSMPDYIRGAIARIRREPAKAIALLEGAVEVQPGNIHALLELTGAYLDVGDIGEAEKVLDQAVLVAADYSVTQFYVAFIQAEQGDLQTAQETLLRTGNLLGTYPAAMRLYGMVTYRLQKYDIASNFLQRYLEKAPDDREVRLALAESLVKSGFPTPALKALAPLLPDDQADADAHAAAGAANVVLGKSTDASKNYEKAVEFSVGNEEALDQVNQQIRTDLAVAQAMAEYTGGNPSKALELMSALDKEGQLSAEHLLSIVNIQMQEGHFEDALKTADKLLAFDEGQAIGHNTKGAIYYRLGKMSSAIVELNKAIDLAPNYQSALKNRAYAYSSLEKYVEAKADLHALVAVVETDGQLYAKLGHTHLMLEEFQEAKSALRQARKLLPTSAVVAANYGYALAQLGMYDEAIEATESAYALATFDKAMRTGLKKTLEEYKLALERKKQAP